MTKSQAYFQQIVKGSGFVFIGQIIAFIAAFIYQIVVARYLGAELFGVLSLSIVVMSVGAVFVKFGLPAGLNRFIAFYSAKGDKSRVKGTIISGLKIFLVSSVIVCGILLLGSGFIADKFFHSREHIKILMLFIMSIPFAALINTLYQIMLGFKRPLRAIVVEAFLHKVFRLVVTIFVILLGARLFGISLAYLACLFLGAMVGLVMLFFVSPKVGKVRYDYRELLKFSFPLFLATTLGLVLGWVDSLMIGYFFQPQQVGIYRVAFGLAAFLNIFVLSFGAFFYPILTGFYARSNFGLLRTTYSSVTRLLFLVTLPIFLIFAFFSEEVITIFYGAEFTSGYVALAILSFAYIFSISLGPANKVVKSAGNTAFIFKVQALSLVVNVALNFLLIPAFGIIGAAVTTVVSMSFVCLSFWFKIRGQFSIRLNIVSYVKYVVSGALSVLVVYLFVWLVPVKNLFWFIIFGIVLLLVYFAMLVLSRAFDETDRNLLKAVFEKIGLNQKWIFSLVDRL